MTGVRGVAGDSSFGLNRGPAASNVLNFEQGVLGCLCASVVLELNFAAQHNCSIAWQFDHVDGVGGEAVYGQK